MDTSRYLDAVAKRHANVEPVTYTDSTGIYTVRNTFWNNDTDYFTVFHLNDDGNPLINVFPKPHIDGHAYSISK